MSSKRYSREFKKEAIKQVVVQGVPVAQVAGRLGVSPRSVYSWLNKFEPDAADEPPPSDAQAEIKRLKKALKRVTEERDCLRESITFYTQQYD